MDTSTPAPDLEDKDAPLKADTRLLGRLLGDVIRAQSGDTTFDKVESIRQESVRFHREGATYRTLDALLVKKRSMSFVPSPTFRARNRRGGRVSEPPATV